jgi:hypothetical protein
MSPPAPPAPGGYMPMSYVPPEPRRRDTPVTAWPGAQPDGDFEDEEPTPVMPREGR